MFLKRKTIADIFVDHFDDKYSLELQCEYDGRVPPVEAAGAALEVHELEAEGDFVGAGLGIG